MNFQKWHKFRHVIEDNKIKPLTHDCGTVLVSRLGPGDEFKLWCVECDSWITPGLDTISKIDAIIAEHVPTDS